MQDTHSKLLKSREEGRELLELLLAHFPAHVPNRCGREEPLRKRFSSDDLNSALEEWGHLGFGLQRRKYPKMSLNVWFAMESIPTPHHTSISLQLHSLDPSDAAAVQEFMVQCALRFNPDIAVAHILTNAEFSERIEELRELPGWNPEYLVQKSVKHGVAETLYGMTVLQFLTKNLRRNIPDLCWLSIFGEPYVKLFRREKLLSSPGRQVLSLSETSTLLKVSDCIPDTSDGWAKFRAARDECKAHLNSGAFYDPRLPSSHIYRVPDFVFPVEMYRSKMVHECSGAEERVHLAEGSGPRYRSR